MVQNRRRWALLAAAVFYCAGAAPAAAEQKVIARIDLSKPFHLPPGASFTATQGPEVPDPNYFDYGDKAPGSIHLCVRAASSAPCLPNLDDSLGRDANMFSEVHYLQLAEIVHPRGANESPLLHLQVGSHYSGDGSQGHAAIILAYRRSSHRFERIFKGIFGGNMNQEARYMDSGPLKGAIVMVQPTDDAPFGYWVAVHRLTPGYAYKLVLRYRGATRYNDGNSLAVVDSEMPNIFHRLGLWRAGQPLPVLKSGCARPRLVKLELWCS